MLQTVHTFKEHFGNCEDYPAGKEPLIQYLTEHTQANTEGFLFKDLGQNAAIFVRKDQLFSIPTSQTGIYRFLGFAADSEVALIEPKIAA